jgi:Na+/proline symporter
MNSEVLEAAWRSSANGPSAAASAYVLNEVSGELRRRRAGLRRLLVFATVALTIPIALLAYEIATGRSDVIDLSREWALIPFAFIPFVVVALAWRCRLVHLQRHPHADSTLLDAFRALLDENAGARARIHLIGAAMALFVPLLAVMLNQLGAVGKMEPAHMVQAGIVLAGGLAAGAVWMAVKYVGRLLPERRQLEALIRQYESGAEAG